MQLKHFVAKAASYLAALAACFCAFSGQTAHAQAAPVKTDLTKDPTLYMIGYSHLDTEWCWSYPQVIREFVANTLHDNFRLFEKYPDYTFNWTGSNRYKFMKEYYPADYAKLKQYVAQGRWFPNGSCVEEGDVNSPSEESIIRQVLYANQYFRREFGQASDEFMLPDCFGFPASLPSIFAHCGLKGFSTQKLTWGSAVGIPFNVGVWEGTDGQGIVAALNPGSYTGSIDNDVSHDAGWLKRLTEDGQKSGALVDYRYYGTGDRGGAPGESSVQWLEKSLKGGGPVHVVSARANQMFDDLTPGMVAKLPRYKGDLLLTQHSAGSITSEAFMKRSNRKNELLADATERASVAADWLGALPYDRARIADAWLRFLPGQFHDLMAGTALPKAYEYAWNDQIIALNEFAGQLSEATGGVSRALDTRAQGVPLVVYNPLSTAREDVVQATITFPRNAPSAVRVFGPNGLEVPAQMASRDGKSATILFLANAPSVGFATYDVRPAKSPAPADPTLRVTPTSIENARYRVRLDANGDVGSIYDKAAGREMLAGPARLAYQHENPGEYPAWNMDWNDQKQPPRAYVDGPPTVKIVENGPVRVALQIERRSEGSRFVQTIRLSPGDAGNRVEFANLIDWKGKESALKAVLPLTVSNPNATYNWELGTVQRGNNDPKKYEVPAHKWFDLTDTDGSYGVSVLDDSKYGSDKPDDHTVRLTLLYSPGVRGGYQHQATQDWGRHEFVYALAGHKGGWQDGQTQWQAWRLNQPLLAFQTPAHPGPLGHAFSLAQVSDPQVQIEALKKAEETDEVIVRLNELAGKPAQNVRLSFAAPILSAREVDGQEREIGTAAVTDGALGFSMDPYRPRAFALTLAKSPIQVPAVNSAPLALAYNLDGASSNEHPTDGNFDGQGRTLPGDLMPASLVSDGIPFKLGPTGDGAKNILACQGQRVRLPSGSNRRVYLLASAVGGDTPATFTLGDKRVSQTIQAWDGYIGQWDLRLWKGPQPELTYDWHVPYAGLVPAFIKRDSVAWYADHRRLADGKNDPYQFCYVYRYALDVPNGANTLILPRDPKIRVFAATIAQNPNEDVAAAQPLYDTLDHSAGSAIDIAEASAPAHDAATVRIAPPLYTTEGPVHYTLDGSAPSAKSPVYTTPFSLPKTATVRAAAINARGHVGQIASARFEVDDTTPPAIQRATASITAPQIRIAFSEPVSKDSATKTSAYALQPAAQIASARLNEDGRSVTLTLAAPLAQDAPYRLAISGVRDLSPRGNAVPAGTIVDVPREGPAFSAPDMQTFTGTGDGFSKPGGADFPTAATAPWTINFFARTDAQPEELTLLGGFGNGSDDAGTQRYLIKFHNSLQFWGSNVDVATGVPLDLGKWQMLTATFDGAHLRIYKNAQLIQSAAVMLSEADPTVKIGSNGPWNNGHKFSGKIAGFSIWNLALPPDYLKTMLAEMPKE